jgi:hypothetical protein
MADVMQLPYSGEQQTFTNQEDTYTQINPFQYLTGQGTTEWGRVPSEHEPIKNYLTTSPDISGYIGARQELGLDYEAQDFSNLGTLQGDADGREEEGSSQLYMQDRNSPRQIAGSDIRKMDPLTRLAWNKHWWDNYRVPVAGEDYDPAKYSVAPTNMQQLQPEDYHNYNYKSSPEFEKEIGNFVHLNTSRQSMLDSTIANITDTPLGLPEPVIGDPITSGNEPGLASGIEGAATVLDTYQESIPPGGGGGNPQQIIGDPVLASVMDSINQ